jgi:hypothetical protein
VSVSARVRIYGTFGAAGSPALARAMTAPTARDNRLHRGAGRISSNNRLLTIDDGPYESTQRAVSALRRVALCDGLRFKSSARAKR